MLLRHIWANNDGFVKNPTSALRCNLCCFKVLKVLIITKVLRILPVLMIGELLYFAVKV